MGGDSRRHFVSELEAPDSRAALELVQPGLVAEHARAEAVHEATGVAVVMAIAQQDALGRLALGEPVESFLRLHRVDQRGRRRHIARVDDLADPLVKGGPVIDAGGDLLHGGKG